MKKYRFLFYFSFLFNFVISAQTFKVQVEKDTVQTGEVINVEFLLENVDGQFQAPTFEGFQILFGPNTSSSFRMINGKTTQKRTYSYAIIPLANGDVQIGSASVKAKNEVLTTPEVNIYVTDNLPNKSKNFPKSYTNPEKSSNKVSKREKKRI